jgi:hypothetical protein
LPTEPAPEYRGLELNIAMHSGHETFSPSYVSSPPKAPTPLGRITRARPKERRRRRYPRRPPAATHPALLLRLPEGAVFPPLRAPHVRLSHPSNTSLTSLYCVRRCRTYSRAPTVGAPPPRAPASGAFPQPAAPTSSLNFGVRPRHHCTRILSRLSAMRILGVRRRCRRSQS